MGQQNDSPTSDRIAVVARERRQGQLSDRQFREFIGGLSLEELHQLERMLTASLVSARRQVTVSHEAGCDFWILTPEEC
jgi:hypothetical protein